MIPYFKRKSRLILIIGLTCFMLLSATTAVFAVAKNPTEGDTTGPSDAIVFSVSPASGTTVHPFKTIVFSNRNDDITFYYTIDGSVPTTSSPHGMLVTLPGTPNVTAKIRILAVSPGKPDKTATYTYYVDNKVSPPEASVPNNSLIDNNTVITFHSSTPGARIGTSGVKESDPVTWNSTIKINGLLGQKVHIAVIAEKENLISAVSHFDYQIRMDAPTALPIDGSYVLPGDTIHFNNPSYDSFALPPFSYHYTTDGSIPNSSSPSSDNLQIPQNAPNGSVFTVKVITVFSLEIMSHINGFSFMSPEINHIPDSAVTTFRYMIGNPISSPTVNTGSGATVANNSTISLSSATAGAIIHYTTNGSAPTKSSAAGSTVIIAGPAGANVTVKALAVKDGIFMSDSSTFTYTLSNVTVKSVAPSTNPATGSSLLSNSKITLSTTTDGATIYYTTDGSTPTENSPTGSIATITGNPGSVVKLQSIAIKPGVAPSAVSYSIYTIKNPIDAPAASHATGSIIKNYTNVTLRAPTKGSTIHYTIDGLTPTVNSPVGSVVTIIGEPGAVVNLKAIAVIDVLQKFSSDVSAFSYTIFNPISSPTVKPGNGSTLPNNSEIAFSTMPETTVYYTLDGTKPTTSSPHGQIVTITGSPGAKVTVKAITVKTGSPPSNLATFTFQIKK